MFESLLGLGGLIALVVILGMVGVALRTVVPTNMVHIVQRRRNTVSYGAGKEAGNVYYKWPSWLPHFGVTVIQLPVNNFDLNLQDYEAYDKDRVPFRVDVTSFFRIDDTNRAAERVASFDALKDQLILIVKGSVRKVLASAFIDDIMLERAQFGDAFTVEVKEQLREWGVTPVKSMELMDIRDAEGSEVIADIMKKKTSFIQRESRIEVARNTQAAEEAEIASREAVDVRKQAAEEAVGKRTAEQEQVVGIAKERSHQMVLEEEKITRDRSMEVTRVEEVRRAEIAREKEVVAADQERQTTILLAEGRLEAQRKEAEGITALGKANAEAEEAMLRAPVTAQIELAKEIGANEGYQRYLAVLEAIRAYLAVGSEQAKALQGADVKVISNAGSATGGVNRVMDLFTSEGGTNVAAMVEGLAQSPMGKALLKSFGITAEASDADSHEE